MMDKREVELFATDKILSSAANTIVTLIWRLCMPCDCDLETQPT